MSSRDTSDGPPRSFNRTRTAHNELILRIAKAHETEDQGIITEKPFDHMIVQGAVDDIQCTMLDENFIMREYPTRLQIAFCFNRPFITFDTDPEEEFGAGKIPRITPNDADHEVFYSCTEKEIEALTWFAKLVMHRHISLLKPSSSNNLGDGPSKAAPKREPAFDEDEDEDEDEDDEVTALKKELNEKIVLALYPGWEDEISDEEQEHIMVFTHAIIEYARKQVPSTDDLDIATLKEAIRCMDDEDDLYNIDVLVEHEMELLLLGRGCTSNVITTWKVEDFRWKRCSGEPYNGPNVDENRMHIGECDDCIQPIMSIPGDPRDTDLGRLDIRINNVVESLCIDCFIERSEMDETKREKKEQERRDKAFKKHMKEMSQSKILGITVLASMIPSTDALGWSDVADTCNSVMEKASNVTCPSLSVCDPVFQALFRMNTDQFKTLAEQSAFFFFVIAIFAICLMCRTGSTLPVTINLSAALIGPVTTIKYIWYSLRHGIPFAFTNPLSFVLIVAFISYIPSLLFNVVTGAYTEVCRKVNPVRKDVEDIRNEITVVKKYLTRISLSLKNIK